MITNAIDAHEGKGYGSVTIRTRFKGAPGDANPRVLVDIADTGNGISPENLDKIFDPFFTTKPVGRGTGLGLSICFSIIKRLGGEISVRSLLGRKRSSPSPFPCTRPRICWNKCIRSSDAKMTREAFHEPAENTAR